MPYDYEDMPSYCFDTVAARGFASQYEGFYQNFDIANPNIGSFDRFSAHSEDSNVPEPILYIVAECYGTSLVNV